MVHKPSGIHTHPSALSPGEDSAARWLGQQLGRRVWPVHRLDRGASGLLAFCLSAEAARELILAFRERRVGKRYLALVRGWPSRDGTLLDEGVVERPLRDLDPESRQPREQEALTRWRVLDRVEAPFCGGRGDHAFPTTRVSLIECRPETGRMHQIRRHLAGMGHPLLGDGEHGDRHLNRVCSREIGLARLALACIELTLPLTEGAARKVRTALDPDLRRVLSRLTLRDPTEGLDPPLFDGTLVRPRRGWRERHMRRFASGPMEPDAPRRALAPDAADGGSCPLCGAWSPSFHVQVLRPRKSDPDQDRRWRSCPECGLVHLDPACRPDEGSERARYLRHCNRAEDAGYREWLRPLVEALAERVPTGSAGLDLGCGPQPVLAGMLLEAGLAARGWDPFFPPDAALPEEKCAWISLCEVFEHVRRPRELVDTMRRLLAPGGWLALSTGILERDEDFPDWWYARDITHLIFARPATLEWIAGHMGWSLQRHGRVILFHDVSGGGVKP